MKDRLPCFSTLGLLGLWGFGLLGFFKLGEHVKTTRLAHMGSAEELVALPFCALLCAVVQGRQSRARTGCQPKPPELIVRVSLSTGQPLHPIHHPPVKPDPGTGLQTLPQPAPAQLSVPWWPSCRLHQPLLLYKQLLLRCAHSVKPHQAITKELSKHFASWKRRLRSRSAASSHQ